MPIANIKLEITNSRFQTCTIRNSKLSCQMTYTLYERNRLKSNFLRRIQETAFQNSGHQLVASHRKMENKVVHFSISSVFSETKTPQMTPMLFSFEPGFSAKYFTLPSSDAIQTKLNRRTPEYSTSSH